MTTPSVPPDRVLAALRRQLVALEQLIRAASQQKEVLVGGEPAAIERAAAELQMGLDALEVEVASFRRLLGAAGGADVRQLAGQWAPEDKQRLEDLVARLKGVVERLLVLNTTNEALLSRSLLITRYSLRLLTGTDQPGTYGGQTEGPSIYNRRG